MIRSLMLRWAVHILKAEFKSVLVPNGVFHGLDYWKARCVEADKYDEGQITMRPWTLKRLIELAERPNEEKTLV